jgi:Gnt-I system high-affinity gluconate transporter
MITVLKMDTFLSFVIISIAVGIAEGMKPDKIIETVETGLGSTLGSLVMIIGFGAMLGKIVADSGAAQRISVTLVRLFGSKYIQWAMVITGFIVGVAMFYNVGFVILVPLIFTMGTATGLPLLYIGIPMLASLSVTHGLLPPHPSPSAIAIMFHADMGKTLLYGILIAIPVIIVAGPFFGKFLKHIQASPLKGFLDLELQKAESLPGMAISVLTALLPVILIIISTLCNLILDKQSAIAIIISFIGNPAVALLISVMVAIYTLGLSTGKKIQEMMEMIARSVYSITMVLLVIAGAGIFKQVLVDSGVNEYIASLLGKSTISPLLLGWLIATVIRVCVGSATVAGLTTAGIILPVLANSSVNAELMVLSIGAGSLMFSHVNDTGFWMYKEYFSLSVKDTFLTWTIMETIIGIMGLIGVLLLNIIL